MAYNELLNILLRKHPQAWTAKEHSFDVPYLDLPKYGGRAFAYTGQSTWSSLSSHLRGSSFYLYSFQRHLKTFFFLSFFFSSQRYTNPASFTFFALCLTRLRFLYVTALYKLIVNSEFTTCDGNATLSVLVALARITANILRLIFVLKLLSVVNTYKT